MVRAALLSCVALLVLLTSNALAHSDNPSHSPADWTRGYTLVLVDANSKAELAEARDFITSQGGTVAIVLPPHAILGWITPEVGARILGRHGIRTITRTPVDAPPAGMDGRETRLAISLFNDIASGRTARRILREAAQAAGAGTDRPPMINCAETSPPINRSDVMRNLQAMGAADSLRSMQSGIRPQFFSASDVMDGTVAVAVFLVESNGSIDPNTYTWSQQDQTTAIAQVIDGLNWWVDQSRAFNLGRPLQFTVVPYMANNPVCQQAYEPVLHPGSDANLWVNQIMNNVGAIAGDAYVRVASFNLKLRDDNRANWGFSMFIAYNPEPAPNHFTDGRASWAYLGGPHINILFRSFGWRLSQLVSHETGHIFYACDEYFQPGYAVCSCTCAPEVRPNAANGNCQDATCNPRSTACMMRTNEFALCPYTVAQIGWTAAVPRAVPTAPQGLVATASSPTQVNLIWQDTSTVEDGFQIERRGGSSAEYSQIAVVAANTTSYSDATALANTSYSYRVRAFNSTGTSSYSAEANVVTPANVSSLSVTTSDLPDATVNVLYSRTLVASGGKPDYVWIIESGTVPPGLTLSQSGTLAGTPTNAGTFNFVARVTDSANLSATKALTLVVKPAAPLTITSLQLPRGSVGSTYSQNLGASGGQTPYTWSIQSGNLPDGLTLGALTGVISGTPERAGISSFVVKLTDSSNASVTATLSITINPAQSILSLDTNSLPDGVVGQDYSQTLQAAGGTAPYRWEIRSGKLPEGLRMSEAGVISGTPTVAGEVQFEVRVSDQSGQSADRQFSIDIDPAPEFTILSPNALSPAAVGVPYRYELKATAGTAPYTWSKKKKKKFGAFPDGITLSSDGVLSGTPAVQGTFNFTLRAEDATGKQASKSFTIEVGPPPPPLSIKTETLPQAQQNVPYNARLEAFGGAPPYNWTLDVGALPAGLTLNTDGAITGRPTGLGSTAFFVRVRDAVGTSTTKQLFIIVAPPPPPLVIQTVSLPETSAERPYHQTLQATGGVPPYSWSIASGSLGAGLNLSASGEISGTPTTPGTSVFVVQVTDAAAQTATRTLAIQIKPADKLAPFGALETPDHRSTLSNTATGTGWALDNVGVVAVEVLVDGQKVADATYGLNRPDIGAAWGGFPNAAHSGFSFTFDTTKLNNGEHSLVVRVSDAAGNVTLIGARTIITANRVFAIVTSDLPRGKKGEAYTAQLQAANGAPPYTWTLASGSLPAGLSLNASGLISGTPSVFGNFTVTVRATDSAGKQAAAAFTLTILPDIEPLRVISSGDLANGLTGVDYNQQLFFAGGRPPVQWALASGALPPGLTLNATSGIISGRPTQAGTFTFTARVVDQDNQNATSSSLSITIQLGPLSVINTGAQTAGRTGADYSLQLIGNGGALPYRWSLATGGLPPGLALNTSTGMISGKPTDVGTFTFTVRITDSTSASAVSDSLSITISAGPLLITSSGDLTGGRVNVDYTHQLTFLGGKPPYTWAIDTGALPAGLTLNASTGVISGKPTASGTFTFTVKLTDGTPQTVTSPTLRIVVSP